MDKEEGMKLLIVIQKVMALIVGGYGSMVMFSEVPETESLLSQLFVTLGGAGIILATIFWLFLISLEEKIVETSEKTL